MVVCLVRQWVFAFGLLWHHKGCVYRRVLYTFCVSAKNKSASLDRLLKKPFGRLLLLGNNLHHVRIKNF